MAAGKRRIGRLEWIALASLVIGFGFAAWAVADYRSAGFWIIGALASAAAYGAGVKLSAAERIVRDGDRRDRDS